MPHNVSVGFIVIRDAPLDFKGGGAGSFCKKKKKLDPLKGKKKKKKLDPHIEGKKKKKKLDPHGGKKKKKKNLSWSGEKKKLTHT